MLGAIRETLGIGRARRVVLEPVRIGHQHVAEPSRTWLFVSWVGEPWKVPGCTSRLAGSFEPGWCPGWWWSAGIDGPAELSYESHRGSDGQPLQYTPRHGRLLPGLFWEL